MRHLRVLWRYVAMNVMMTLEYRGAFLLLMVQSVLAPTITLLVWLTVSDQGVPLPYRRDQFVAYYLLLGLVSMLTACWLGEYLANRIRLGRLSPLLLRPSPPILAEIGNNVGEKIIKLPLILPLVAIVAIVFRGDLRLPTDPGAWALFLLALPLSAAVAFLLDYCIGSLAFWIEDARGLLHLRTIVGAFLAGRYVPLALFPAWAGPALEAQPFRYTLSFPLEVVTGALGPEALARGFAWQIGWCLGLFALYRVIWALGLRSYGAVGA